MTEELKPDDILTISGDKLLEILEKYKYGPKFDHPQGWLVIRTDTSMPILDYRYPNRFVWSYSRFTKNKATALIVKQLHRYRDPKKSEIENNAEIDKIVTRMWTTGLLKLITFEEYLTMQVNKSKATAKSINAPNAINSSLAQDKSNLSMKVSRIHGLADQLLSKLDKTNPEIISIEKELEEVINEG